MLQLTNQKLGTPGQNPQLFTRSPKKSSGKSSNTTNLSILLLFQCSIIPSFRQPPTYQQQLVILVTMKRKAEDDALESPNKRLAVDMLEDMSTGLS